MSEQVMKPLTEVQKKTLSMRLDMIRKEFGVVALRVLCEDGSEWKVGVFPTGTPPASPSTEKKKITRKRRSLAKDGYVVGTITRAAIPWVELAITNPGEEVRVNPYDFPDLSFRDVVKTFSSSGINRCGRGNFKVQTLYDGDCITATLLCTPEGTAHYAKLQEEKARKLHKSINEVVLDGNGLTK